MDLYLKLFNFMWRIKRVEWCLSNTWSKHMILSHAMKKIVSDVASEIHRYFPVLFLGNDAGKNRCHLLRNEMVHFVYNLQHYIMFEVLESAWEELSKYGHKISSFLYLLVYREIKEASSLDEIIEAIYMHFLS
jgi:gamma-tubulin complex component 3